MAINFRGYLYDDSGNAIQGATVQLLEQDGDEEASTTTDSNGLWYFSESDEDSYDVKITRGSQIRYIQWDDQISIKELDVRNSTGNTTPAATFTNLTNNASSQVANFRSLNTTRADGDEIYLSFTLADDGGNAHEFARMTAEAVDVSNGSEDGQIRFGVSVGGTMTDVFTINSTTAGSTDMTLDVSGDLTLDADGGDVFFKDGGTTFGSATNNSGNLIIKSGTTTALTFSGANVTAAGTIGSGAITSTGIVTGTGFTAGNAVLAEAELELLDGLTAGTAIASKVVTTDANIDTTGQRNLTITGELDAATLDISGNSDFDGTLDVAGNTVISAGTFTVGSDGSGQDVIFYSGTSGDNLTWDSSEEVLQITGTNGATALDVLDGDVRVVDKLYFYDRGGEYLSSDGSTLTITGATTVSGGLTSTAASNTLGATSFNDADITNVGGIALDTITSDGSNIGFGTDGSGEDVYFYSATSGDHMFWDASDEKLVITGTNGQNSLEVADGNVTITDNLTVSGDFTVSGTTTTIDTTNLTVTDPLIKLAQGTTASPANDLGIIFTRGNGSGTNIANRAILWDESADIFVFANTDDEAGTTTGNVDIDDYASIRVGAITADDNSTFTGTISAATGSTIGNITLANGSITDSSGALDFGNETLTTTGAVDFGAATLDSVTATGDFTTTGQATDWDLIDNNASALSFDASGKTGILEIVTTNSSEAVNMSGGLSVTGTATFGSLSDGSITITAFVDEDDMSSNSATLVPTQQSVKAYADSVATSGDVTAISSIYNTSLKMGRDSQNLIDFATTDNKIILRVNNVDEVELVENALSPVTSDGVALGTTSLMWSDLFVASGGVINFNNGDMTLTHSSNTLTAAGGTVATAALTTSTIVASGIIKTDDTTNATSTTDGSLQTDGGLSVVLDAVFGDDVNLLSDSSVLTFGANSEITLTHVHDVGLNLKHTATADDKPIVLTLQTGETDMQADDVIGKIAFQAPDEGTGTDAILVAAAIQAVSEGNFSSSNNATKLSFMTGASEAAAEKVTISSAGNLSLTASNTELRFYEGANYVGFEAGALSGDQIWVLPTADGSADQVLTTNGSGTLSFATASGGLDAASVMTYALLFG